MKTTALKFALSTTAAAILAVNAFAVDSTSPPVGFVTLPIAGSASGVDNVMSLPMMRDAVFSGTVGASVSFDTFDVLSGPNPPGTSPGWTVNQFQYASPAQRLHYYVEVTSGQLNGVSYEITSNGTGSLTVETGGDDLTNRPLDGASGALQPGDKVTIRPYWTIKDVFEVAGARIIEESPGDFDLKDQILIPNYTTFAQNKSATRTIYYDQSEGGWRNFGQTGVDFADFVLRPNEAFVLRSFNAGTVNTTGLTNTGAVLMTRSAYFVNGGFASGNDTYISVGRPVAVKLDDSGLVKLDGGGNVQPFSPILGSSGSFDLNDTLLAFPTPTAQNQSTVKTYFYETGAGWRDFANDTDPTIGQTVFLEPGKAYILRKNPGNSGTDWTNNPNY